MKKLGVLLVNLGTPDDPSTGSVRRYLKEFLLDPRVIDTGWLSRNLLVRLIIAPFRAPKSAALYKELWTEKGSPLKHYGYRIEKEIQNKLGDNYMVRLAMRYQNPSLDVVLDEMKNANLDKIVVFPMFPQYASASTGSALQKVMELVAAWPTIPEINFISAYHDNDAMLDVYVRNAQKYTLTDYDHFLFSFHGIPQRQLIKSDCGTHCLASENCCQKLTDANKMCYSAQCYDAAFALAAKMKLDKKDFSVAFQSRLGREKWTEPFTPDVLEQLIEKGIKRLLVFSPSFTADCLETTIEIGTEYQEDFIKMGGEKLDLVESLNDNPLWIDAIHEIIRPYLYAD